MVGTNQEEEVIIRVPTRGYLQDVRVEEKSDEGSLGLDVM